MRRASAAALSLVVAVCLVPSSAAGQGVGGADSATAPPHVLAINAAAVRPGTFVYATSLDHDTVSVQYGQRTVSSEPTVYVSAPATLLLETRQSGIDSARDSLFVDPVSLAPMHWTATLGRATLAFEFRGDTAYGGTSAPTGKRSEVTVVPPGSLVNAAMLETLLRSLPLGVGYQDSTLTLSVNMNTQLLLPTTIAVIGRESVRVPAGTFDCWVVAVHAGDHARGLYWVTTADPIVVQSEIDVGGNPPTEYVSRLVSSSIPR